MIIMMLKFKKAILQRNKNKNNNTLTNRSNNNITYYLTLFIFKVFFIYLNNYSIYYETKPIIY